MTILLTGATGTLGSQVLFSLLETRFHQIENLYLLVRGKGKVLPKERILNVLTSEAAPEKIRNNINLVFKKVTVIDSKKALLPNTFLKGSKTYFIHSAGLVNLSTDPGQKEPIFQENLHFTQTLFETYLPFLKKFIYISTAFAIGKRNGILRNNYLNIEQDDYRNFYEASKHATEKYLNQAGETHNVPVQILRPSVLGGNFLDKPNCFISKHMVFYLFAKFFHRNASSKSVRIEAYHDSLLNIIPADYAAKVITKVFDTLVEQLNIVNPIGTNIHNGIQRILETVDFKNFSITQELLHKSTEFENTLEKFYYETIGVHLTPYLTSTPQQWDTTLLESILPFPKYDLEDYLVANVAHAKTIGFKNQKW
jgi:nucleoside-diphosphate-sugar epimerase